MNLHTSQFNHILYFRPRAKFHLGGVIGGSSPCTPSPPPQKKVETERKERLERGHKIVTTPVL